MFENIENLKILDIIKGSSVERRSFRNRVSHAFVFKISGESIYEFENRSLLLNREEMLVIPKGASYDVERISEKSEYILINFDADVCNIVPRVYSMNGYSDISYIYNMANIWLFANPSERYKCYGVFYNVISYILTKEKLQYPFMKKLKKIECAVNYLQSNIFDCDLRVDDLCLLCGISDTYFRKIFKSNFGVSP